MELVLVIFFLEEFREASWFSVKIFNQQQENNENLKLLIDNKVNEQMLQASQSIFKRMKKITFVQRPDQSSYDPVSTFFSKKKPASVAKPPQTSSKKTSGITSKQPSSISNKPYQKVEQKSHQLTKTEQQKYEKLKQEVIYDLKQKQVELQKQKLGYGTVEKGGLNNPNQKSSNAGRKINSIQEKRPQWVFDEVNSHNQDEYQVGGFMQEKIDQTLVKQISQQEKVSTFPSIKTPSTLTKNQPPAPNRLPSQSKIPQKNQAPPNGKPCFMNSKTIEQKNISKSDNKGSSKQISKIKDNSEDRHGQMFSKAQFTQKPNQSTKKIPKQQTAEKLQTSQTIQQLRREVQLLTASEKEYTLKIEQLESRIQTLVKIQQKYQKLLKEHRLCSSSNKQLSAVKEELKLYQNQISQLLSSEKVDFDKKRQYLLLQQVRQLRKTNKELVLRIKNYKGTDLVEMAISRNKEQITREFQIEHQEDTTQLNAEMQANLRILIGMVWSYLQQKSTLPKQTTNKKGNAKKNQTALTVEQEHKFLSQLTHLAQKLSLKYLEKYEISPLPTSNESAINIYAQIQHHRQSLVDLLLQRNFNKLSNNVDMNLAISQNNLQILNHMQQNSQQINQMQQSIQNYIKQPQKTSSKNNRPDTSYGKLPYQQLFSKVNSILQIFLHRSNISTSFHIQSICYFQFLKQIVEGQLNQLKGEIVELYGRLKQLRDIYELGGNTASQSLYLFLETNLQQFILVVPNLELKINQIRSMYHQIDRKLTQNLNKIVTSFT